MASRPVSPIGTLTTMLGAIFTKWRPSASIPSTFSAITSAETGPDVILQISARMASYEPPTLAYREGLVVTPSSTPQRAAVLISSMSAVSRKIFIAGAPCVESLGRPEGPSVEPGRAYAGDRGFQDSAGTLPSRTGPAMTSGTGTRNTGSRASGKEAGPP